MRKGIHSTHQAGCGAGQCDDDDTSESFPVHVRSPGRDSLAVHCGYDAENGDQRIQDEKQFEPEILFRDGLSEQPGPERHDAQDDAGQYPGRQPEIVPRKRENRVD